MNAAPHRCSRSACSAVRQAHASTPIPPILPFNRLSHPRAPSQSKLLVVVFVFVLLDIVAAHAVHGELIAASRASASCDFVSMKCSQRNAGGFAQFCCQTAKFSILYFFYTESQCK